MRIVAAFSLLLTALSHGTLIEDSKVPGRQLLHLPTRTQEVILPNPAPDITKAYFAHDRNQSPITLAFTPDGQKTKLLIPPHLLDQSGPVALEVSGKSQAFPDGRVVFSAKDAKINGATAKLESQPGNQRIGFWKDLTDTVEWDYKATTWGMYDVDLTYSLKSEGSEIEVTIGPKTLTVTLDRTKNWYHYTTVRLGRIYLPEEKSMKIEVKGLKKSDGAVMNLKALTLRPAPEGKTPIVPAAGDSSVTLMARESTVYGVKLRYEPQPKKLCVGYWTHPTDFVTWDFEVIKPASYEVEFFQGCGKGEGGSTVDVLVGNQTLAFTVQDTGHFQNFVPQKIGAFELEPGVHTLEVRPRNKTKIAVMDIQKIILRPKN